LRIDYYLLNAFKENREIFVAVAERVNKLAGATRHCSGRTRRCKEFQALYNIGKLTHIAATPDDVLDGVASNLAWATDHPQATATRVVFDGREYLGSRRRPQADCPRIVGDLIIEGRKRGEIEMYRLKRGLSFSLEKQELLSDISATVSKFLYRKEIETRLNENTHRLQTLFDAITDRLLMISTDFSIKMVNKNMDVVGQKCHQAFYGRARPCHNCPALIVNYTRHPAYTEKRDGSHIFDITVYPILGPHGEITDMVVHSRNISQQKNLEQQLVQASKLASLGELVSGIAHEINNPNTFIRGNISIIAEAFETILPLLDRVSEEDPGLKVARLPYHYFRDKINTLVSDMQKGADRITNIISDLRQFARPDEEQQDEDIAINEVIETCQRLVHNQVKRYAEIHLDLPPDLPVFKGSVQKMEQVLVNIIINASHAIADKKETGNIWIRTLLDQEGNIQIHIRDDGIGMTPDVKERLFNPFFTTKRHRQGTGLGLSIAYGIITSFKGIILVDSQPGEGSEFKIVVPHRAENTLAGEDRIGAHG
jgi:signal transduction histidine kinase